MTESWSLVLDILSWAAILSGSFFMVVGGIGLLRLPELYCRTHASGLTDTLGAMLLLLGLMFQAGFSLVTVKLILVLGFLLITGPVAAHALVKAAYAYGIKVTLEPEDVDATSD